MKMVFTAAIRRASPAAEAQLRQCVHQPQVTLARWRNLGGALAGRHGTSVGESSWCCQLWWMVTPTTLQHDTGDHPNERPRRRRPFLRPPSRYETYDSPEPAGPDELVVDVLAVGLHPRVRSDAAGRHYTSTGTLPMIPGVDGVGRLPDGQQVYFVTPDDVWGSMAERAVVDGDEPSRCPKTVDTTKVAAAMSDPAVSPR